MVFWILPAYAGMVLGGDFYSSDRLSIISGLT
jgi:hypothetical protein